MDNPENLPPPPTESPELELTTEEEAALLEDEGAFEVKVSPPPVDTENEVSVGESPGGGQDSTESGATSEPELTPADYATVTPSEAAEAAAGVWNRLCCWSAATNEGLMLWWPIAGPLPPGVLFERFGVFVDEHRENATVMLTPQRYTAEDLEGTMLIGKSCDLSLASSLGDRPPKITEPA